MEIFELIKRQEAQCRLALTELERAAVAAFFAEREGENSVFRAVNPPKNHELAAETAETPLREDVPSADADRKAFLDMAPDGDGVFVKVPRTL